MKIAIVTVVAITTLGCYTKPQVSNECPQPIFNDDDVNASIQSMPNSYGIDNETDDITMVLGINNEAQTPGSDIATRSQALGECPDPNVFTTNISGDLSIEWTNSDGDQIELATMHLTGGFFQKTRIIDAGQEFDEEYLFLKSPVSNNNDDFWSLSITKKMGSVEVNEFTYQKDGKAAITYDGTVLKVDMMN